MPGTKLKCTSPECNYETPNAPEFGKALSILQMHPENSHVFAVGNAIARQLFYVKDHIYDEYKHARKPSILLFDQYHFCYPSIFLFLGVVPVICLCGTPGIMICCF